MTDSGIGITIDAGYFKPATIGDFVFEDKNGNGIQDPTEPGIAGVTVKLNGSDGQGNPCYVDNDDRCDR
ncbi:MAG: hypothetical protein IPP61_10680 [Cytophagaceae bacterium]|nr:hypothetical protein [Cytophagaceae bacterium]